MRTNTIKWYMTDMGKTLIGKGFIIMNWEPTIVEQELMDDPFKVDLNEILDDVPERKVFLLSLNS